VHRVHHTDTELDVSTTVRFHPLEFVLGLVIGAPLVVVFGLHPAATHLLHHAWTATGRCAPHWRGAVLPCKGAGYVS
jgi:sterol desaturase/sphingolipid hydroxylase (fatty acid hydroxylase superfamily)